MDSRQDIEVLKNFFDILKQLDIAYAIGGSVASSIYGKVRFTQDVDITVEPFEDRAEKLFNLLKSQYYVSKQAMQEALSRHGSFNIIHLESALKIDVFVRGDTAFEKQLLSRAKAIKLSDSLKESFAVVSPEDIILLKLQWYQNGGQVSDRQWRDVLGVLAIRSTELDFEYLTMWSGMLGVNELLDKAVSESESGPD
jgi:hypothetical protein